MENGKKSRNSSSNKAPAGHRSDRKSGSGMSGDPKKGGRGGKFTWEGADGYYADEDLDLISNKGSPTVAAADRNNNNKKAHGRGDDK